MNACNSLKVDFDLMIIKYKTIVNLNYLQKYQSVLMISQSFASNQSMLIQSINQSINQTMHKLTKQYQQLHKIMNPQTDFNIICMRTTTIRGDISTYEKQIYHKPMDAYINKKH